MGLEYCVFIFWFIWWCDFMYGFWGDVWWCDGLIDIFRYIGLFWCRIVFYRLCCCYDYSVDFMCWCGRFSGNYCLFGWLNGMFVFNYLRFWIVVVSWVGCLDFVLIFDYYWVWDLDMINWVLNGWIDYGCWWCW